MDIKIIGSEPVEQTPPAAPLPVVASNEHQMEQLAIGRVLGLETESEISKYSDNLKTLAEYAAHNTTEKTPEAMKWCIRQLELKLGTPPFAEDRVKFVARYAWLLNEERRITEEKKKFERL